MEASLLRAKLEASRADGISWGMRDDAIEENEVSFCVLFSFRVFGECNISFWITIIRVTLGYVHLHIPTNFSLVRFLVLIFSVFSECSLSVGC